MLDVIWQVLARSINLKPQPIRGPRANNKRSEYEFYYVITFAGFDSGKAINVGRAIIEQTCDHLARGCGRFNDISAGK